ncbi:MAG TPA: flagellar biosynthetic protein FliO [Steroidobacteraceae bacterium]
MRVAYSVAVAVSLYTTAAFATSDTSSPDSSAVGSLVVALVLVTGAAAAATWVLRHWKGSVGRREGPLQLVHVIALGPRERLALVKIGGRYLVVGITPTSINRVADLSDITDNVGQTTQDEAPNIAAALDPNRMQPPSGPG